MRVDFNNKLKLDQTVITLFNHTLSTARSLGWEAAMCDDTASMRLLCSDEFTPATQKSQAKEFQRLLRRQGFNVEETNDSTDDHLIYEIR